MPSPESWKGETCSHGYPVEYKTECSECSSKENPSVDIKGVRPKINFTEEEIDSMLADIEEGEFETGKMVTFTASAEEQDKPIAVSAEELEAKTEAQPKPENRRARLERESQEAAKELIDILAKGGNVNEKIQESRNIVDQYLDIFKDDKAKRVGRMFLSASMTELSNDLSDANRAEVISAMQSLGLRETKVEKTIK